MRLLSKPEIIVKLSFSIALLVLLTFSYLSRENATLEVQYIGEIVRDNQVHYVYKVPEMQDVIYITPNEYEEIFENELKEVREVNLTKYILGVNFYNIEHKGKTRSLNTINLSESELVDLGIIEDKKDKK